MVKTQGEKLTAMKWVMVHLNSIGILAPFSQGKITEVIKIKQRNETRTLPKRRDTDNAPAEWVNLYNYIIIIC